MLGGLKINFRRLFPQIMVFAVIFCGSAQAQDVSTGLVGHWTLDEKANSTLGDSSPSGNDGTWVDNDNNLINEEAGSGVYAGALTFDGIDDQVQLGMNPDINITDNTLSISAWVRRATPTSVGPIMQNGNAGSNGYALGLDGPCPTANHVHIAKFGVADSCFAGFPADTEWHHLVAVMSTSGVEAYVDGVSLGSNANTTALNSATNPGFIGANDDQNNFFGGAIDDVRVYDRALTAEDVATLYGTFTQALPCNAGYKGALTFNNDALVLQYCNGTDWIDAGPRNSCGQASCGGNPKERLVFALQVPDGNLGKVTGADTFCTKAKTFGIRGNYLAWIADTDPSTDPESRFERSPVPYVMVDGSRISDNWDDLVDGTIDNPINLNSLGTNIGSLPVYTNVDDDGTQGGAPSNISCGGWQNTTQAALVGDTAQTDASWTLDRTDVCNVPGVIYCFEQGPISIDNCTNPGGVRGEINYNHTTGQMQYCDGSAWINMGPKDTEGGSLASIPTAGLIGYWDFDDGTGSTVLTDRTANGNHGTLVNMDEDTDWVDGIIGTALAFNAANSEVVNLGNDASLDITDNTATITAWLKKGSASDSSVIYEKRNIPPNFTHGFTFAPSVSSCAANQVKATKYGFADICLDGAPLSTDWHHYALVFDATTGVSLYVDGELTDTNPNTSNIRSASGDALVGDGINGGRLDELRIYDRDLSAAEIKAIYEGTIAGTDADCTGLGDAQFSDSTTGHCYYRVDTGASWSAAQTACESNGAYLAVITSERENDLILQDLGVQATGNAYWFGANDLLSEGEWRWQGGELSTVQFWQGNSSGSVSNGLYNDWETNEPNNVSGIEDCAAYLPVVGYQWADAVCTGSNRYICEKSRPGELTDGDTSATDPCNPANTPSPGQVCNDGTVYAGTSNDGGEPMYTTRCDHGQSWNGSTCTGTRSEVFWNAGNSAGLYTTNGTDPDTGEAHTDILGTQDADLDTPGFQEHVAGTRCYDLEASNKDDWYLPARSELAELYSNRIAIGQFDLVTTDYYWASSETNALYATSHGFHNNFQAGNGASAARKNTTNWFRCVRKGYEASTGSVAQSCSSPAGVPGEMIYNDAHDILQYCNGTNWIGVR